MILILEEALLGLRSRAAGGALLVAVLSVALEAPAQTSVVALWTPTEIVVGADSKFITRSGPGTSPACKIAPLDGGVFFAAAGLTSDSESGFNLSTIVKRAVREPGTLREKVDDFEGLVDSPLTVAVQRLKQEDPQFYEHYVENKGQVLQALFFGFEGGEPVLYLRTFEVKLISGNISVIKERSECPGEACHGTTVFLLGYSGAASAFVTGHPDFWKKGLAQAAGDLVEMEIAEVPQFVGPPIDVLHIDGRGAAWVHRKKQCPEIKHPGTSRP